MNRKQLEAAMAADKTVAYAPNSWSTGRPVKVLDLKAPRRVYSGQRADWNGHPGTGVKIEYADGHNKGEQLVVASQSLKGLWSEFRKQAKDAATRQAEQEARVEARKKAAEVQALSLATRYESLTGEKPGYGKIAVDGNGHSAGNRWIPTSEYHVKVHPSILAVILDGDLRD